MLQFICVLSLLGAIRELVQSSLRSSTKLVNPCRKELEKGVLLPGGIKWQSQAAV